MYSTSDYFVEPLWWEIHDEYIPFRGRSDFQWEFLQE